MARLGRRLGNLIGREEPLDAEINIEDDPTDSYNVIVSWPQVRGFDDLFYHLYLDGALMENTSKTHARLDFKNQYRHFVSVVTCGEHNQDEDTDWVPAITLPTGNRIALTWSAASDAYAFKIYANSAGSTAVDSLLATTLSSGYTTTPLQDGNWYLRVNTLDEAGNEKSSSSIATVSINTWPEPPKDLSVDGYTAYQTYLSWSASISSDVVEYRIYTNFVGGSACDSIHTTSAAAVVSGVSTTLDTTSAGTWEAVCRAYDGTFEENNVMKQTWVLGGSPLDFLYGFPSTPSNLQAFALSSGQISLYWEYGAAGESGRGTLISVYTDSATGTVDYTTALRTTSIRTHNVGDINFKEIFRYTVTAITTDSAVYTFAVRATATDVEETNTAQTSVTVDATAPNDLTGLTATIVK